MSGSAWSLLSRVGRGVRRLLVDDRCARRRCRHDRADHKRLQSGGVLALGACSVCQPGTCTGFRRSDGG